MIFNDDDKNQMIYKGLKKQRCKKNCPPFKIRSDEEIDICLVEMEEDIIDSGKSHNVLLQTLCLPTQESEPGSKCFTSGLEKFSKTIDAVFLNLFNHSYCDGQSFYSHFGININENQLCAGIPSENNISAPFSGKYEDDFGGPLICFNNNDEIPIFTGVTSSNSLSTKSGQPGLNLIIYILSW